MKNEWIDHLKSTYVLKITGKNVSRFIRKLIIQKIELLKVDDINHNEVRITIYKKDYNKVIEQKTIYEIDFLESHGIIHIKKIIKFHKVFIFFLFIGLIILYILSHMIFSVQIVHTNHEIRDILTNELSSFGIKKNHFKKSYKTVKKIKKKILERHKDKIEWLEIENIGTKYIVRVEMRKLKEEKKETKKVDIIAKKDAVIKQIVAESGEIIKKENDYVKKGDIIISGNVFLNDKWMASTRASGKVYGEVWYNVKVSYPYIYYEEYLTGKKNTVYTFKFLNKRIELFNVKPYKEKNIQSKVLLKNNILPISLEKEKQSQKKVIRQILTEEEATIEAVKVARKKMQRNLSKKEHIISEKKLKVNVKDSKIVVDMFFTVYEDITDTREVEEIQDESEKQKKIEE